MLDRYRIRYAHWNQDTAHISLSRGFGRKFELYSEVNVYNMGYNVQN